MPQLGKQEARKKEKEIMRFKYPLILILLVFLPLFWWLEYNWLNWCKKAQLKLVTWEMKDKVIPYSSKAYVIFKMVLWSLVFISIVIGLARPQGRPSIKYRSIANSAIFFILDGSLSMLAEDISPSRLFQAKALIRFLSSRSQARIALIGFSGEPKVFCPLTIDTNTLELGLQGIQVEKLGRTGSGPIKAINLALDKLSKIKGNSKVLVVLSDGEANKSGNMSTVIKQAREQGVRIYTVGIGTVGGAKIPVGKNLWDEKQYRIYKGKVVKTYLNSKLLYKLSHSTQANYYLFKNVEKTGGELLKELKQMKADIQDKTSVIEYQEFFSGLVAIALFLLGLEFLWPRISKRKR